MANKQEEVIYIGQENISEAEFMSGGFINEETKKRAYINALSAELGIKYLESVGIKAKQTHNLHSLSKILEKYDIADIMLPNIHIDVRMIFDENQIFIPKSHFEQNLTPDIYFILKLSQDFKYAEILGFIKSEDINKNNSNKDFYFVEKDELTPISEVKSFINKFEGNTSKGINEKDLYTGRELSVQMSDHNISPTEEKEFIRMLLLSDELRESVLEFDNFETLSYNVGSTMSDRLAQSLPPLPEFNELDNTDDEPEPDEQPEEIVEEEVAEEVVEEKTADELEEITDEEGINELSGDLLNEEITDIEEPLSEEEPVEELTDDLNTEETDMAVEEISLDSEEEEIPDTEHEINEESETSDKTELDTTDTSEEISNTIEASAATGSIAGAAEVSAASMASEEAIKLAGISGDLVNELVNKELEGQQEHLNKIDYSKTTVNAKEVPEHIAAYDLADAKEKADKEAEKAGFVEKTNLSDLKNLEISENTGYGENIEQEVIDLNQMETVETETYTEHTDNLEDIENLTSINSPTKPIDNLEEKLIIDDLPGNSLDFSNMSSFDINADGTSSIDNINIDFNSQKEEELVDIGLGSNEFIMNTQEDDKNYLNNNLNFNTSQKINIDKIDDTEIENITDDLSDLSDENNNQQELPEEQEEPVIQEETEVTAQEAEFSQNSENTDYTVEELSLENLNIFEENDDISEPEQEENANKLSEELISEEESPETTDEIFEEDDIQINEVEPDEPVSELDVADTSNSKSIADPADLLNGEEWLEDTNYDNLPDTQTENPKQTTEELEIIDENFPAEIVEEQPEISPAEENTTVISDKTHTVGEIAIDINKPSNTKFPENEQITNLYKPNTGVPGAAFLQSSGKVGAGTVHKRGIGGILGVILTLFVVGAIGFGVSKMIKQPAEETPQPITDDTAPASFDNGVTESDTLNITPDNVIGMEDNNPVEPNVKKEKVQPQVQKTAPASGQKSTGSSTFVDVSKLSWEVPDYISYDPQFKQYFQSTGRRLKLALSGDLLLATDGVHTNQAKVSILFDKDGTFKVAKILLSSGSTQIDNIVLQTVNQTLKGMKAPHSIGNDESTTVILKIYF